MARKVYGLYDPKDGEIRYVGITALSLETRRQNHVTERKFGSIKSQWLDALMSENLEPGIFLLGVEYSEMGLDSGILSVKFPGFRSLGEGWWICYLWKLGARLTNSRVSRK